MEKNLIIGGVQNYGINELKPWVLSIEENIPDAHRVICYRNISEETQKWLANKGFELVEMPDLQIPVHVLRFLSIYEYLRQNHEKYRYVLTTDVKDVYFQKDPFDFLEKNNIGRSTNKIVCGSECLKYKDEWWGNENLMQTYGSYVHSLFKDETIYNVGVLAGTAEYIKDLVFNIFTNGVNRPIQIVDQAVFNVLINTQPYKDVVKKASMSQAFACQAGTVADPSKIGDFRPNLLEEEPVWNDGVVETFDGRPFYIVHQYDRVPEWKKFIAKKYGQQIESEFFTYKV